VFLATCLDNSSIGDWIRVRKCDILESKLYDGANEPLSNYHVHFAVWVSTQGQQHVASPATKYAKAPISFALVKLIYLFGVKGHCTSNSAQTSRESGTVINLTLAVQLRGD
jgi:hypothetical protein